MRLTDPTGSPSADTVAAYLELTLTLDDESYLPPGLPPDQGQLFAKPCAADSGVKRAWLVRKNLTHTPQRPLYVVIVEYRWLHEPTQDKRQALVTAMPDIDIPLFVRATRKPVARRVTAIAGARVYQRG